MDKKAYRRTRARMRMSHGVRDRQKRFLSCQRLADNPREETGRRLVWLARPHANGRQPDTDAIKKSAPRIVGEQQFANCLLRSVGGQWREVKVIGNGRRKRRTENGDRRRKYDLRFVFCSPDRFEQRTSSIEIDTVALFEIGLRFAGN